MSATGAPTPPSPRTPGGLVPQLVDVPAPQTVAEAVGALHDSSRRMQKAADLLLKLERLRNETPEMRTVVINPGNNGQYQTLDQCPWTSKSIGVLNPSEASVYIGIGGISASAIARAPSCPAGAALVLPLSAGDLLFGCDSGALGASTAVIYVFRYVSVQPLSFGSVS